MISTGNDRLTPSAPIAADQPVAASITATDCGTIGDCPPDQRTWTLFWIAAIASALPMLCFYLVGLWKVEHYQFFPFVFAFVIGLAHSRSDGIIAPPRGRIAYALIALGLLLIAFSVAIFSPWFSAVGLVLIVACLMASLKEPNGRTLSVLVLPLLALIRLPLNFDSLLITSLQSYTSRIASWFLDLAAVPHLVSGNIIELVNHDLFVAEACSGIQSVFTLLFLSSLIMAYRRRPLWMVPGYWVVALLVAVLCNSFRVATVSAAASLGIDWATGLSHTLVGYVALATALILLLSFDQCVELVVHPIEGFVLETENWTNPLIRRWDRHIVGHYPLRTADNSGLRSQPGRDRPVAAVRDSRTGNQTAQFADSPAIRESDRQPAEVDHATAQSTDTRGSFPKQFALPKYAIWSTFATAMVLVAASLVVSINRARNAAPQSLFVTPDQLFQPALGVLDDDLPASVRILGHEVVRDSENPRLGESADIWTIGSANWQGQIVLSQTYPQWHELCICYQNLEWQLNDRSVIQSATNTAESGTGSGDRPGFVLATFRQGISGRGYLLFSAITYDGKAVTPPDLGPFGQLANRLSLNKSSQMGDMMMLQLWIETAEGMSASDLDLAKRVFGHARDRLRVAVQTTTGN